MNELFGVIYSSQSGKYRKINYPATFHIEEHFSKLEAYSTITCHLSVVCKRSM